VTSRDTSSEHDARHGGIDDDAVVSEEGHECHPPVAESRNGRVEHGIDDGAGYTLRADVGSDRLHHLSTQVKAIRGC
jgi:hypothetical protein